MIHIRKLLAHETGALLDHLLRLDDADRRLRFGHVVSADTVRAYTTGVDWSQTWVVGLFDGGILRGVAELRRAASPKLAELSVTVERAYQNRGLGTRLLERALVIARNRGFETLFLQCLPENLKMQHVARKFGDHLRFQEGDVEATITSPGPDAISFCSEILEDAGAFWQALLLAGGLGQAVPFGTRPQPTT
jgi:GNAT superfamily N-acetyltransferase